MYSPRTGDGNPLESEFLYKHKPSVTFVICCVFPTAVTILFLTALVYFIQTNDKIMVLKAGIIKSLKY